MDPKAQQRLRERKNDDLRIEINNSIDFNLNNIRFKTFTSNGNNFYLKEEVDNELRYIKSRLAEITLKLFS